MNDSDPLKKFLKRHTPSLEQPKGEWAAIEGKLSIAPKRSFKLKPFWVSTLVAASLAFFVVNFQSNRFNEEEAFDTLESAFSAFDSGDLSNEDGNPEIDWLFEEIQEG